jgi:hypothetical protein
MKVALPEGKYIQGVEINDDSIDIHFKKRKKVALVFISLNPNYWPYLKQVIEDCRINFLPHHKVDYFVWTDMPDKDTPEYEAICKPNKAHFFPPEVLKEAVDFMHEQKDIFLTPMDAAPWPAPTLMRYHLFLQKEEELSKYDYVFYLDADMRVVDKISDEILGDNLTAAEHPMYSLRREYIPPYEPNPESTAYISRPGKVVDDSGKQRFKPYYYAGGFQGGKSKDFIRAMREMKKNIDIDFDHNYTAIWNDESHWNKYLSTFKKDLIVLPPSYIYPDSLIKEYYEPIWGKSYQPKIITLTKPFSLSADGAAHLNEFLGRENLNFQCPTCHDVLAYPEHRITKVVSCPGSGNPHQLEMVKI